MDLAIDRGCDPGSDLCEIKVVTLVEISTVD